MSSNVYGDNMTPIVPRERAIYYRNCPFSKYNIFHRERSGGNFRGWGRVFYLGGTFYGKFSHEGKKILMNDEYGLPALFEKRSEIK